MKNHYFQFAALRRRLLVCLMAVLLSGSAFATPLTINNNSIYYNATHFNKVWTPALWTSYFGGSGFDTYFSWNSISQILTVNQDLILQRTAAGARMELTIDGLIIHFATGTKFTVEQGEHLTLTNSANLSGTSYWEGIEAKGVSGNDQFECSTASHIPPEYKPFDGSTQYDAGQTMVELHSSSILYAHKGVSSDAGAIIISDGASFYDCAIGIEIKNYTHPLHNGVKPDLDQRNASYISATNFTVAATISPNTNYSSYKMISLDDVKGVHIQGGAIELTASIAIALCADRGYGLYAHNSAFVVHPDGTATHDNVTNCVSYSGTGTSFKKWSYGIYCEETGTPTIRASMAISGASFTNTIHGIKISKGQGHLINACTFDIDAKPALAGGGYTCADYPKAIHIADAESFVINNNSDIKAQISISSTQNVDLINIDNCGTTKNKIMKNTLDIVGTNNSITKTGIRFNGTNTRVEPWCSNSFSHLTNGIWVESGPINKSWTPVDPSNGDKWNLKNTFSSNLTDLKQFSNMIVDEIDYHEFLTNSATFSTIGAWDFIDADAENPCTDLLCNAWYPILSTRSFEPEGFKIYPNPKTPAGIVNIDFAAAYSGSIRVYSALGQLLFSQTVNYTSHEEISTAQFSAGVYIVVMENSNGTQSSSLLSITE